MLGTDDYPVKLERTLTPGGVEAMFARVDHEQATEAQINQICSKADGILMACSRADHSSKTVALAGEAALYVIARDDDRASKIGVTTKPLKRLNALQTGSAERLSIAALYWMQRQTAFAVENYILAMLGIQNNRGAGEWALFGHERLVDTISWCLKRGNASFSDSYMFAQNLRNIENMDIGYDPHSTRGFMMQTPEDEIIDRLDNNR